MCGPSAQRTVDDEPRHDPGERLDGGAEAQPLDDREDGEPHHGGTEDAGDGEPDVRREAPVRDTGRETSRADERSADVTQCDTAADDLERATTVRMQQNGERDDERD